MIPKAFWDEISVFNEYLIPVSGGVDSTYIYQIFKERGLKFSLFWNNTGRSLPSAREVLSVIFSEGYPFDITYPYHDQKMITEKTRAAVEKILKTGKYHKPPCCYYLKEAPYIKWMKKHTGENTVVVSGLAPYEGSQRGMRLGQLRNWNTFLRFKKVENRWFAYPLRDCTKRNTKQKMRDFLYERGLDVKQSSCFTCPVVAIYEEAIVKQRPDQKEIAARSKKVWLPTTPTP